MCSSPSSHLHSCSILTHMLNLLIFLWINGLCSNQRLTPLPAAYPHLLFKDITLSILSCVSGTISLSPLTGSFYLMKLMLLFLSVFFSSAIISCLRSLNTCFLKSSLNSLQFSPHALQNSPHSFFYTYH